MVNKMKRKLNTIYEDTIASIATSVSNNAISIIRVSGTNSLEIVSKIFSKDIKNVQSHTIHYGFIKENNNDLVNPTYWYKAAKEMFEKYKII